MKTYDQLTKSEKIYVSENDELRHLYYRNCKERPGPDWKYDGLDSGKEVSYWWCRLNVPLFTEEMLSNRQEKSDCIKGCTCFDCAFTDYPPIKD